MTNTFLALFALLLGSVAFGQPTTAVFDHAAVQFLPYDVDTFKFCRENPQTPTFAGGVITVNASVTCNGVTPAGGSTQTVGGTVTLTVPNTTVTVDSSTFNLVSPTGFSTTATVNFAGSLAFKQGFDPNPYLACNPDPAIPDTSRQASCIVKNLAYFAGNTNGVPRLPFVYGVTVFIHTIFGDVTYAVMAVYKANAPSILLGGVVNGASFQSPVVRGSVAAIFGSGLASSSVSASALPLPLTLGGAQVTMGGVPAPLLFASPGQLNIQVPFETPIIGNVPMVVTLNGIPSPPQNAVMAEYAPGIFSYPASGAALAPVIAHGASNTLVTAASPAKPGEVLVIYATGVGSFDSPPATGAASPAAPPAQSKITPVVTVGGMRAQVQFSGLTPGLVGVAQINIQLPAALPAGSALPVVVSFGNASSKPLDLAVSQ